MTLLINPEANYIINGGFDWWQRNTAFSSTSTTITQYTADRWFSGISTSGTAYSTTKQTNRISSIASDFNSTYSIEISSSGFGKSGSNADVMYLEYFITADEATSLNNKVVSVSFNMRNVGTSALANGVFSCSSAASINSKTGTWTTLYSTTLVPTAENTVEARVITFKIPNEVTIRNGIIIRWLCNGNTTGSSTTLTKLALDQVKLEIGPFATSFVTRTEDYVNCLKFYEKTYEYSVAPGTSSSATGQVKLIAINSNDFYYSTFQYKVPKYVTPAIAVYSPVTGASGNIRNYLTAADNGSINTSLDKGLKSTNIAASGTISGSLPLCGFHLTIDGEIY